MNDNDPATTVYERHRDPARQRKARAESAGVDPVEATGVPEAVWEAAIARRRDSATPEASAAGRQRARAVEWVRPTDLIARQSGTVAGRGIGFHAELYRRARTPATTALRQVSNRARRLPPVSAFGRRGTRQNGPARSGVGMA